MGPQHTRHQRPDTDVQTDAVKFRALENRCARADAHRQDIDYPAISVISKLADKDTLQSKLQSHSCDGIIKVRIAKSTSRHNPFTLNLFKVEIFKYREKAARRCSMSFKKCCGEFTLVSQ